MTEFSLVNRWQNQNILVKIFRWLKYKPYYVLIGLIGAITHGGIHDECSRMEYYHLMQGMADCKMQHWYTSKEVFRDVKRKR